MCYFHLKAAVKKRFSGKKSAEKRQTKIEVCGSVWTCPAWKIKNTYTHQFCINYIYLESGDLI